ncbi:MAG: hypothetical protein FJ102_01245 [Deltaproteobacteria bacterium]|nr:hypothetical protein [Deltaproteobacteria bacterium]
MQSKSRVTVTLDTELLAEGQRAVNEGRAASLSAWVASTLAARVAMERKLQVIGAAIAAYEDEFGEITPEETAAVRAGSLAGEGAA